MVPDTCEQLPVVLVWLERAEDGTAPGTHLDGTVKRISASTKLRVVKTVAERRFRGPERRRGQIARLCILTLRALVARKSGKILVARYHPLILPIAIFWRITAGRVVFLVQGTVEDATSSSYPFLRKYSIYPRLARSGARLAHVLIAGSPEIEGYVRERLSGPKAIVGSVPNGVDTALLKSYRDGPPPTEGPYAVFVGALATWQGVDTMIAAAASHEWPKGVPLYIIGDGVERELVLNQPNVRWLGRMPSSEAHTWLAHALVSLCLKKTSHEIAEHGYWPFKLIESAAVGTPAVTTLAKGAKRVAEDLGHAIVVAEDTGQSVAMACRGIYSDTVLRAALSKRALENVHRYDWLYATTDLESLILKAVKPKGDR